MVGDLADAGFDEAALDQLAIDIESGGFPNTHAVLVEHDGVLVYERYFSGTDRSLLGGPLGHRVFGPESLHDLRSISKSVTSALLGIALETNFESAVEKPVSDYLLSLELGEAQRAITLHHALTMTAGLRWNEMDVPYTDPTNDETRLMFTEDPARYVMARPLEVTPGSVWYYNGGLTQVVATVIFSLTGQALDHYARTHLFEPLGITDYEWIGPDPDHLPARRLFNSTVPAFGWTPDNPAAMSGLRLRARDLAKIGSVFLHDGRWRAQQVVPSDWVDLSTRFHTETDPRGMYGYGYQWWHRRPAGSEGYTAIVGMGNGGQRLFVLPDERLVVTIFAGNYNTADRSDPILDRIMAARRPAAEAVSAVTVEFRLAATETGPGLLEATIADSEQTIYVRPAAFLSNEQVQSAVAIADEDGRPAIEVVFTPEGRRIMATVTGGHVNRPVAILVDGVVIAAPTVREQIDGGVVRITENLTQEEARRVAAGIMFR